MTHLLQLLIFFYYLIIIICSIIIITESTIKTVVRNLLRLSSYTKEWSFSLRRGEFFAFSLTDTEDTKHLWAKFAEVIPPCFLKKFNFHRLLRHIVG